MEKATNVRKIADAIEKAAADWGGKCKDCGFEYREYNGHIIPCPRCRAEIAVEAIKKSDSALTIFRALQAPHDGIEKDGIEAAEIISETLKKLDL